MNEPLSLHDCAALRRFRRRRRRWQEAKRLEALSFAPTAGRLEPAHAAGQPTQDEFVQTRAETAPGVEAAPHQDGAGRGPRLFPVVEARWRLLSYPVGCWVVTCPGCETPAIVLDEPPCLFTHRCSMAPGDSTTMRVVRPRACCPPLRAAHPRKEDGVPPNGARPVSGAQPGGAVGGPSTPTSPGSLAPPDEAGGSRT